MQRKIKNSLQKYGDRYEGTASSQIAARATKNRTTGTKQRGTGNRNGTTISLTTGKEESKT